MRPFVVALHFDGVLATYDKNRGVTEIGRPVAGAREFCRWLHDDIKAVVMVITGRRRLDIVDRWLTANDMRQFIATINQNLIGGPEELGTQVVADLYIGQRYLRFTSFADVFSSVIQASQNHRIRAPETLDW